MLPWQLQIMIAHSLPLAFDYINVLRLILKIEKDVGFVIKYSTQMFFKKATNRNYFLPTTEDNSVCLWLGFKGKAYKDYTTALNFYVVVTYLQILIQ